MEALGSHLSVIVSIISSGAINDNPNMAEKKQAGSGASSGKRVVGVPFIRQTGPVQVWAILHCWLFLKLMNVPYNSILLSLSKIAYFLSRIEFTKDNGKDIIIDVVEYIGY